MITKNKTPFEDEVLFLLVATGIGHVPRPRDFHTTNTVCNLKSRLATRRLAGLTCDLTPVNWRSQIQSLFAATKEKVPHFGGTISLVVATGIEPVTLGL